MQTESDFIVAFLQFKILRGEAGDEFVCRATGKNRVYPQPDGGSDGCPDKIPQYLWNRRGYKLYEVKDITVDREKLENLIRLCNQEQLSLLHLRDVVEDFLTCL